MYTEEKSPNQDKGSHLHGTTINVVLFVCFFTFSPPMCATRKRAPVLRHHEDTFFVILVFLMFCWFFFCSQVYNEEKRWKTKGPTYTALWGHFFATPRCNPQMTGRRGWRANSSPRFYVCDICQVWSFSLFVTSGFKTLQNLDLTIFSGIWLNAFKS